MRGLHFETHESLKDEKARTLFRLSEALRITAIVSAVSDFCLGTTYRLFWSLYNGPNSYLGELCQRGLEERYPH